MQRKSAPSKLEPNKNMSRCYRDEQGWECAPAKPFNIDVDNFCHRFNGQLLLWQQKTTELYWYMDRHQWIYIQRGRCPSGFTVDPILALTANLLQTPLHSRARKGEALAAVAMADCARWYIYSNQGPIWVRCAAVGAPALSQKVADGGSDPQYLSCWHFWPLARFFMTV